MYDVSLSEEAQQDLAEALDYYDKISEKLRESLFRDFDSIISYLEKYPKHYPLRYKEIRIASTTKFSYGIHYRIDSQNVRILRILHHKQCYKGE